MFEQAILKSSEHRMIPLAIPNLSERENELLTECVRSTFVSSVGPFVDEFETEIASVSGTARAAVLCSGTVALQMALEGLGIGPGDLVMIPTLTFIATANAVSHSGARPWLVDVTADGWMLDLALCRRLILELTAVGADGLRRHAQTGEVLRALIPVMVMGAVVDFEGVRLLAQEFDLKVIIDAAAAIGARAGDGVPLGMAGADAVCYSFNGNKTITTGGGGAVAAADDALVARIKHLSSTGRVGPNYDHDVIAYNFRMTNLQAALGLAQLERLDRFLERKREIFHRYAVFAESCQDLAAFPDTHYGRNGHWLSGFWYTGGDTERCDAFRAYMREQGVDLRAFWKPIHLQTPYRTALASDMPVADGLWSRIFPLPCSTHLGEDDLEYVLAVARRFWGRRHA